MEITETHKIRSAGTYILLALLVFSWFLSEDVIAKAPSKGTVPVLVLMVDFSDNVGQVQSSYFDDLLFGNTPAVAPNGSMADYYSEVSFGQLTITGQVNNGMIQWFRMPELYSYYVNNQWGRLGLYPLLSHN